VSDVFTHENLHATYGGQLKILTQAADALLRRQEGQS
jgi:hypothetical protein